MKPIRPLAAALVSLALSPACDLGDKPPLGRDASEAMTWNAMTWNAMTWNALATVPEHSAALTRNPLNSSVYRDGTSSDARELREALADPLARTFMDYLATCALSSSQTFQWKHPTTGAVQSFRGLHGLCTKWGTGAPDQACQEIVSACILARNNAFGVPVQLSMHGVRPDGVGMPLAAQVRGDAGHVASVKPCTGTTYGDVDCGWTVGYVGVADPDDPILIRGGASCRGHSLVRICPGDRACDRLTAVATHWFPCSYGGTFTPRQRTYGEHRSVFTVMTRPWRSTDTVDASVELSLANGAGDADDVDYVTWPASELLIYTLREGAFYGNIFDTEALGVQSDLYWIDEFGIAHLRYRVQKKFYLFWNGKVYEVLGWSPWYDSLAALQAAEKQYVVYRNMHACHGDDWNADTASELLRVCAGPTGEQCAANWVGNCSPATGDPDDDRLVTDPAGLCAVQDSPARLFDRDYDDCRDRGGRVWQHPITTFLKSPCDADPVCLAPF